MRSWLRSDTLVECLQLMEVWFTSMENSSALMSILKESSRQRPRSAMSRKTPGEVRARTCGTKSPSRSEALRFIDSSKSPSSRWGFGWVDKAQCFRSARRFGAAGSSPDFSRGFSRHGAPWPLSWTFFQCTLLSYPGQPSYSLWWVSSSGASVKWTRAC